jgi:tetratricopeptide (TPR) repeat protein
MTLAWSHLAVVIVAVLFPQAPAGVRASAAPPELVHELTAMLDAGDLAAAKARVDEALARYPSDAVLHNIAGAIDAEQGAYRSAERHFRTAIQLEPRGAPTYLNLGRLYQEHASEDPDALSKALAAYRELLRFDPANPEALYQAAYVATCSSDWRASQAFLERLPEESRSRPQALALLAVDLAGLGERRRARDVAGTLLAHPDLTDEDVRAVIARTRDDDLVERLLTGLDRRGLASAQSLRQLGLFEARRNRFERARDTLERAMKATGGATAPLLLDLARVAYKQKDFQGALGYLAHARDLQPQNAEVHFFFGITCVELNLGSEAYDALKKAVALAPQNAYVNYAMGAVAIHRHEPSEALPYFEAYVRLKPEDPRGRFALGAARFYSNEFDAARADLDRAVRFPETAAGAHYFLARIARQANEFEKARQEITLALKADPEYADAWSELGYLQTRSGEYPAAEASLMKALARDPDSYTATVNLVALYSRTRDPRREEQATRLAALQEKRSQSAQEFLRIIQVVQ